MATIDIAKLQANLMTEFEGGNKQVLETTIMQVLPSMFGEMPSASFTNQSGSTDSVGNVTFYKTVIQPHNVKDFDQIGDLTRFKNISSHKILVALDNVIENPVKYYSSEVAMGADGILAQTQMGITMNMAEARELSILKEEWACAHENESTQVKEIDLDTIEPKELERLMDASIAQLRLTKDVGITKVPSSKLIIKVMPQIYQRLLEVKLLIPGAPMNNEGDFTSGKFLLGKYKGIQIIEDVYFDDAQEGFLGSIQMIGAIASPWRSEGVANHQMPGEATIFLLNPQVRFKTKAIYPNHVIVFKKPTIVETKLNKIPTPTTKLKKSQI